MIETDLMSPVTAPTAQEWDLERLLGNRRWVRRSEPFPHVVAHNVFRPDFYTELERDFRRIQSEVADSFARNMTGYDASSADLAIHHDGPLGVFVSREWHDLIARVAGVEATGDVHATLHHHEPGSASGWPHNDLNPGWFPEPVPAPDAVGLTAMPQIHYGTGPRDDGAPARETVRAVSVLYYLGNGAWQHGDGGETGLFSSSADAALTGPAAAVAPLNNSLVLFECTPFSWHTFLSNHRQPRDSVVMWLHRDKDEAVRRWGEANIAYW